MKVGVLGKKVKTLSNLISTLAFVQILQSWKLAYVSLLFSCFLSFFLPSFFLWGLSSVGLFVSSPARHQSVRPSVSLFCLSVCLFICLSACLSVYLCGLCLSVSQSVFSFLLSFFVPQTVVLKTQYISFGQPGIRVCIRTSAYSLTWSKVTSPGPDASWFKTAVSAPFTNITYLSTTRQKIILSG